MRILRFLSCSLLLLPAAAGLARADDQAEAKALLDKAIHFSLLGESKLGDRTVIGLKVVHKDHRDVKLFFDKGNHLLLKEEMRVKDVENDKEVVEEMLFSDYKEIEGTQQSLKIEIKW